MFLLFEKAYDTTWKYETFIHNHHLVSFFLSFFLSFYLFIYVDLDKAYDTTGNMKFLSLIIT